MAQRLNESNGGEQSEPGPATSFMTSPTISDFLISPTELLASRPDIHNIIAGALVFRSGSRSASSQPEALVIRRAASDSFPLKWEVPAGTADQDIDQSVVAVAVRELWEETRLRAHRLYHAIGLGDSTDLSHSGAEEIEDARVDSQLPMCLLSVSGSTWAVATFLVELEDEAANVVLRADEHVDWAWVTEEEVKAESFNSRKGEPLELVSRAMKMVILEGFRLTRVAP